MTILNKIREKFKFTVGISMHWKNVIVDSADSALKRDDACRSSLTACCAPNDKSDRLEKEDGTACELEYYPTEECLYTKGASVFKIGDNINQENKAPGTLLLEVFTLSLPFRTANSGTFCMSTTLSLNSLHMEVTCYTFTLHRNCRDSFFCFLAHFKLRIYNEKQERILYLYSWKK